MKLAGLALAAAVWILGTGCSATRETRSARAGHSEPSHGATVQRPVYPHSVIPGGVDSAVELKKAIAADPVVRNHYREVASENLQPVRLRKAQRAYVSFRRGDKVYWTSRKVMLAEGETVLAAGEPAVRGRCGNRIAFTPQSPVLPNREEEPTSAALSTPLPQSGVPYEKGTASEQPGTSGATPAPEQASAFVAPAEPGGVPGTAETGLAAPGGFFGGGVPSPLTDGSWVSPDAPATPSTPGQTVEPPALIAIPETPARIVITGPDWLVPEAPETPPETLVVMPPPTTPGGPLIPLTPVIPDPRQPLPPEPLKPPVIPGTPPSTPEDPYVPPDIPPYIPPGEDPMDPPAHTPEPGTALLLGAGISGLVLYRWSRRRG